MSESIEVTIERPSKFEAFGGWLRFFQIINIIPIVVFVFVILGAVVSTFFVNFTHQEYMDFLAILVESLPRLFLSLMVVRVITKREERVPDLIKKYLVCYLALSLLAYAGIYFYYKYSVFSEKPSAFFWALIFYYSFKLYLERSKRVAIYYGNKAI